MSTLVVTLPLCPDAVLSPNSRAHWRTRAAAVKSLRHAAWASATAAVWMAVWETATGPVTVRATIGWGKGRKRMDQTNLADMLKPVFDGFEDAGVYVNDKQITACVIEQERDSEGRGFVRVVIEA